RAQRTFRWAGGDLLRRNSEFFHPTSLGLLTEADSAQVGPRPLGDRQRLVEGRWVHVLLHRHPTVVADLLERVPEGGEIHDAARRLTEHVVGYRGGERDVLALDPLLLLAIDALQMKIRHALVVAAEEGHRVAAAIGVMAGIEAQRHPLG